MYVFISSEWGLALHEFTDLLVKLLGKDVVMVIGQDEKCLCEVLERYARNG